MYPFRRTQKQKYLTAGSDFLMLASEPNENDQPAASRLPYCQNMYLSRRRVRRTIRRLRQT